MKERTKGLLAGLLIATLLLPTLPALAAAVTRQVDALYMDIKLVVDGAAVTPKDANGNIVEPFVIDGTTYLPVRAVGEALGKTVEWDGKTSTVYVGTKPGQKANMFDKIPAYQSDAYTEYSSAISGGTESFSMAGQKYIDGCVWAHQRQDYRPFSIYNLNGNYKKISGLLAHVDGSVMRDVTLSIYLDGVLSREIQLTGDMIPQNLSIDVSGVLQLKIELSDGSNYYHTSTASYGLGNVTIQ